MVIVCYNLWQLSKGFHGVYPLRLIRLLARDGESITIIILVILTALPALLFYFVRISEGSLEFRSHEYAGGLVHCLVRYP